MRRNAGLLPSSIEGPALARQKDINREEGIIVCFTSSGRKKKAKTSRNMRVMLAVILVIVVGTLRLIGGTANSAFSATASSITR